MEIRATKNMGSGVKVKRRNYLCPHCQTLSIPAWEKFKSHSLKPTTCSQCGKQSYSKQSNSPAWPMLGMAGVPLVVIGSVITKSWWPVLLAVVCVVVLSLVEFHYQLMVPADIEKAKKQHWWAFIALLVLFAWLVYDGFVA